MGKQLIKLNEDQLHKIILESVKKILKEDTEETMICRKTMRFLNSAMNELKELMDLYQNDDGTSSETSERKTMIYNCYYSILKSYDLVGELGANGREGTFTSDGYISPGY